MIPTKEKLVKDWSDFDDIWHQRWSTFIAYRGDVYLSCRRGDKYEHYAPLDGLIATKHDIERLRRVDWYAVREEHEDSMCLYRFEPGGPVTIEPPGPVREVFRVLFEEHGGMVLRRTEREELEGAAT